MAGAEGPGAGGFGEVGIDEDRFAADTQEERGVTEPSDGIVAAEIVQLLNSDLVG